MQSQQKLNLQLSSDNVIEDFVNSPDTAAAGDLISTQLIH